MMEIDMIPKLKVEELKEFLCLRGLKVHGCKEDLVARVFVAHENNVPLVKAAEEVEQEIVAEYKDKLVVDGEKLPNPCHLEDGWINEEDRVNLWPTRLYPDTFNFGSFHPSELKMKI